MSRLDECRAVEEDDVVDSYLARRLPDGDAEAFERHYLGCDRCAAELERAVELRAALRTPAAGGTRRSAWPSRALAVAASVAFVAVGIELFVPQPRPPEAPAGKPSVAWRGGAQALTVTALRRPGGGIELSWVAHPDAESYVVRVLASDGAAVLERHTTEARMDVAAADLAGAPAPLRVRVKAMSPLGHAVAESQAVEVQER